MLKELISAISDNVGDLAREVSKHSPAILMVVGAVGVVAAGVGACKATIKAQEILDESKETIDTIHKAHDTLPAEKYSEEDYKKDLCTCHTKTAISLIKCYAPSILLAAGSFGFMFGAHAILARRAARLAAALGTVTQKFREYRAEVEAKYGTEAEREIRYGINEKEVTEIVDGKEETHTVKICDASTLHSPYAFIFDETCLHWTKDPELNRLQLESIERMLTERLHAHRFLSMNEVRDVFGLPPTASGHFAGWYIANDPKYQVGSTKVDLGIWDMRDDRKRAFINGHERSVIIDPNCIDNVLEHLGWAAPGWYRGRKSDLIESGMALGGAHA